MKRIRFYIGLGKDHKALVNIPQVMKRVLLHMAEVFGGYTAYEGSGGWTDREGKLVQEPSMTIEVYASEGETLRLGEYFISDVAVHLREAFRQACVMVTVEDVERSFV